MSGLKLRFSFANPAQDKNGKIWIYDNGYQALFTTQSDFGILRLCEKYDFSKQEKTFYCKSVFALEDNVFIVENSGNTIIRYNTIECKSFFYYNSLSCGHQNDVLYTFYEWGNKIFGIPYKLNHSVLVFNIYNKKFEYIDWFHSFAVSSNEKFLGGFSYQDMQYVYIPVKNTGDIIIFNLSSLECEIKHCGDEYSITTCCIADNTLFLAVSKSDQIFRLDKNEKVNKENKYEKDQFSALVSVENFIIALPRFNDEIVLFDMNCNEINRIFIPDARSHMEKNENASLLYEYIKIDNCINTLPWVYPYMLRVNPISREIKILKPIVSYKDFCKIVKSSFLAESEDITLSDFVSVISTIDEEVLNINNKRCGEHIYKVAGMY